MDNCCCKFLRKCYNIGYSNKGIKKVNLQEGLRLTGAHENIEEEPRLPKVLLTTLVLPIVGLAIGAISSGNSIVLRFGLDE